VSIMRTMRGRQAGRPTLAFPLVLVAALSLLCGLAGCAWVTRRPPGAGPPSPTSTPLPSVSPSPQPDLTAYPACTAGVIETIDVPTIHLDKPLHASIYLPPCYALQPEERYPVLYLFHGQADTDQQWIRIGAPRTADRLIAAGEVPPFIIVMPYDPLWREPDQYGFEDAVLQDLLPAIAARYRTLPDRLHRAVGGLSRGSGWAFRLGLSHPELFGAIGAHSVIVFAGDGLRMNEWLAAMPAGLMPRLYLDIGDNDSGLAGAMIIENMLLSMDIPHEWHLNVGFHDEAYWSRHVEEYLRWYASGW